MNMLMTCKTRARKSKIPNIYINHEHFSCAIDKNSLYYRPWPVLPMEPFLAACTQTPSVNALKAAGPLRRMHAHVGCLVNKHFSCANAHKRKMRLARRWIKHSNAFRRKTLVLWLSRNLWLWTYDYDFSSMCSMCFSGIGETQCCGHIKHWVVSFLQS